MGQFFIKVVDFYKSVFSIGAFIMARHIHTYSKEEIVKCLMVSGFGGDIPDLSLKELRDLLSDLIQQGDAYLIEDIEEGYKADKCPECESDNIANEGPSEDSQIEITYHDCSNQWTEEC